MQTKQQRTTMATAASAALLADVDYRDAYIESDACFLDVLDDIVPSPDVLGEDEYNATLQEFHTQMTAAGYAWPK